MQTSAREDRNFMFLQGPHGPFFDRLARRLERRGARCWRVGFNRGDQFFWSDRAGFIAHTGPQETWLASCSALMDRLRITDLVLYGDTRPIHALATAEARRRGIRVHVFEEGYLRPYWVTYERGGSNGNSAVMTTSLAAMRAALPEDSAELAEAPAHWGDMREHVFYGALYHFFVLALNRRYSGFRPHRALGVAAEFRLYLRKLALLPWHAAERALTTRRIRAGGFPYHLVLLQLDHDASFRDHGPFAGTPDFIEACLAGFAAGALPDDHLVFKAHPLDDGRVSLRREIATRAARHGIGDRVHFLRGGKLAMLLDRARSAVTVNSTAGQQVLWRGLPLLALGRAIYSRPELVNSTGIAEFFAAPNQPETEAYAVFRRYLLETSQLPGGYYSLQSRRRLLPLACVRMLDTDDPYAALIRRNAARKQQLSAPGS
ncbi:MAG: capsule biosynthesis protein [Paracoccaceae bacterium]